MKLFNHPLEVAFTGAHLRKYRFIYIIVSGLAAIIETFMAIRFLIKYGLEVNFHLVTLISYFTLLVASLLAMTVLLIDLKHPLKDQHLHLILHIYSFIVIVWSCFISYMDVYKGNNLMVFLAMLVIVGGIVIVNPIFFFLTAVIGAVSIVALTEYFNVDYFDSGMLINLFVFVALATSLSFRHYRVSIKEFELQKNLEQLSYFDQLTSVYNRRVLTNNLEQLQKNKTPYMLGMIDVDNFKRINDLYGHNIGDDVVIKVATLIKKYFGEDNAYRYGGDEFTVLSTTKYTKEQMQSYIDTINQDLKSEFLDKAISVSAGFYYNDSQFEDYLAIIKEADSALYEAKNNGKSTSVIKNL